MFFNSVFKSCEKWWPWFWRIISCISIGHNHSFKQVKRTLVPYHGYCPWITTTHEWFPWPRRGYSKMFYNSNVLQRLITLFASNCLGIGKYFFKAHRSPRHQSNSHPPSDGCCSEKVMVPTHFQIEILSQQLRGWTQSPKQGQCTAPIREKYKKIKIRKTRQAVIRKSVHPGRGQTAPIPGALQSATERTQPPVHFLNTMGKKLGRGAMHCQIYGSTIGGDRLGTLQSATERTQDEGCLPPSRVHWFPYHHLSGFPDF